MLPVEFKINLHQLNRMSKLSQCPYAIVFMRTKSTFTYTLNPRASARMTVIIIICCLNSWLISTRQFTHFNFLALLLCFDLIARMKIGDLVLEITVGHLKMKKKKLSSLSSDIVGPNL